VPRLSSPAFIDPMAAKVVQAQPEGEDWLYEVKFDGYRALLLKNGKHVPLRFATTRTCTLQKLKPPPSG
jgi:ATP-dependent DNA ligase